MLNHVLKFSVEHRWLVVLLTLAAAMLGGAAMLKLPIDAVPDISSKIVQITTVQPALSPVDVEKQITFPIETALAGIHGLRSTRSLTRNGFSQVEAVFEDDVDIYFARQQVLERLAAAREDLPADAEPRMGPITTGLGEVYVYALRYEPSISGDTAAENQPGVKADGSYQTPEGERLRTDVEKLAYLRTLQDWLVKPQLRTVPEVAGIDAIGGYDKQYVVQPDPVKLVAYGLALDDLLEALERNNTSAGAGFIEYKGEAYVVRTDARVRTVDEIGAIVIGGGAGTPVYIRDVARVEVGKELRTGAASMNGEEVVVGTVLMLLGGNSRTVAENVSARIEQIRKSLPRDVVLEPVLVRTDLVDRTIKTVEHNLFMGALLVIVVLFLLLGNFRAAVLTALAIPLAMLFTAFGMQRFGISANLMSLGALDFGLVVDGAVIIVENCLRQIAERQHALGRTLTKQERLGVVLEASREVRSATAFGEAIIILVYFPILALTGVEGKMFHPMAITVILALVAAFVLSLTFIPAMVAIVINGRVQERENVLVRGLKCIYQPLLNTALRWRWGVALAGIAIFVVSLGLFTRLGQEFVPQLDEGNLSLQSLRIPSTSLTQSQALQSQVERRVSELPEVALMYSKTGTAEAAFDPMPPNISDGYVILKPHDAWPDPTLTKEALIEKIRAAVAEVPGNLYEFSQPIELRVNELVAGVRGDLAVKVFGDDFEQLTPLAQQIVALLQAVPGASDVRTAATEGFPQMQVEVDRAGLARHGLDAQTIQDVVSIALGGREAGHVFEGDRRFDILVRLPEAMRGNPRLLEQLPIPLPQREGGELVAQTTLPAASASTFVRGMVPLGSLARVELTEGIGQINREDGKRRLVVQANVSGRDLGSFVAESRQRIEAELTMPPGTWLAWGGQYENLIAARQRLMIVVPFCFFMIFLLLFTTFNSVKYALLVFSGVPLALTGGIAALWLRGIPFSISAAVGFIALSGVAVLNGLVIVTCINRLRQDGLSLREAVERGALMRLRPVLMTALVAALGFAPMAFATGTGAEVQRPLATVVIGGIITSTLLTMFILPVLYSLAHRAREMGTRESGVVAVK